MTDRPTAGGSVPLVIDSPGTSSAQPITVGLPLPRSLLADPRDWQLTDAAGSPVPVQTEPLARWPDGSVRWLLIDFVAGPLPAGQHAWRLGPGADAAGTPAGCRVELGERSF